MGVLSGICLSVSVEMCLDPRSLVEKENMKEKEDLQNARDEFDADF